MTVQLKLQKLLYAQPVRLCHSLRNVRHRRKYVSKLQLYSPGKMKLEGNCISHELLVYNSMLFPCHRGSFYYLPMILKSLEKLTRLIDEEMQAIGAQKISMPSLISARHWKQTGRWDTPELFKLKDRHSKEYCLGPTHEEPVTNLIAQLTGITYKRLPIYLYQITRKFRDEMQPKHGLLRGREFEMKDLYTFDADEEAAKETYMLVCDAYTRLFNRLNLHFHKVCGHTGNIGGTLSHEFHLPSKVGEDTLYVCDSCGHGTNSELCSEEDIANDDVNCTNCPSVMRRQPGIEVGHAFLLGKKYSSVFDASYIAKDGKKQITEMGCYGLGVSRILQSCVEVLENDNRIRWPGLIAPYQICLITQKKGHGSETFNAVTESLYDTLCDISSLRNEVIIDDRTDLTVGKRLHEADTQGFPYLVIIGRKVLSEPKLFEVITTSTGNTDFLSLEQLVDKFSVIQTI